MHPTIRSQSWEMQEWQRYFQYLGGDPPVAFQRLIDWPDAEHEYTVPDLRPEWFDPDYARSTGTTARRK